MKRTTRSRPIKIDITNVYAGGCYTATICLGSHRTPINALLDTGSSSLCVNRARYDPGSDALMKPTRLAQQQSYVDGCGWAGPVVRTRVSVRHIRECRDLDNVYVAATDWQEGVFEGEMHGMLGLAYVPLDYASRCPRPTWPHFDRKGIDRWPEVDIEPYFTELEKQGTTPNKFSMYTLRSQVRYGQKAIERDAWNRGYLILGGGEEYTSLYTGKFADVKVLHDVYYNTHLISVSVGSGRPIRVPRPTRRSGLNSNSIIDSGTNTICFPTWLYRKVLAQFSTLNPEFSKAIERSNGGDDIKLSEAALRKWPKLHFAMEGTSGDLHLTVSPQCYWQLNANEDGAAYFAIDSETDDQTILGLPFMNGFFCVFDRSADRGLGVVRLAQAKPPR